MHMKQDLSFYGTRRVLSLIHIYTFCSFPLFVFYMSGHTILIAFHYIIHRAFRVSFPPTNYLPLFSCHGSSAARYNLSL